MSTDTSFTFIKLDSSIKDASGATGNDSSNNWGTIALLEDGVALQNFFNNPSNISFAPPLVDVSEPEPELFVLTDASANSTFIKDYLANRDSYFPPNTWNTSQVHNMSSMFRDTSFNEDISSWDVSKVTDMNHMFMDSSFNQDIGSWDVRKVTNMTGMFQGNRIFNQDISDWETGSVNDMSYMFFGANIFSKDINTNGSKWDVSNVNNMAQMFRDTSFNEDISNWNVSNVNNMKYMFAGSSFNQDISNWSVNSDCCFNQMFNDASMAGTPGIDSSGTPTNYFKSQLFVLTDASANSTFIKDYYLANPDSYPPPNTWDTSQVTNMSGLFLKTSFNEDISNWDVSNVTDMIQMFYDSSFNRDIGSWNVSKVTNMVGMFQNNPIFNQDISDWETGSVNYMGYMFAGAYAFNKDINTNGSKWDVSNVNNMAEMFNTAGFNQDISNWNVNKVTNMKYMFAASSFNQDISNWPVNSDCSFTQMFTENPMASNPGIDSNGTPTNYFKSQLFVLTDASANSTFIKDYYLANPDSYPPPNTWNTSQVTDMSGLFLDTSFNEDISNWDVSNVTNMAGMFYDSSFNRDISNWNVSNVTNMFGMFYDSSFNRDISNWDVSNVNNMVGMFYNSPFNQDINTNGSKWDVSNVTDMTYMFYLSQFNQDISNWNVSNVTSMVGMFVASSFNQDISNWNVSSVNEMSYMFAASPFNQDISNWSVNSDCSFIQMFNNPSMKNIPGIDSSGTPTNYFKSQPEPEPEPPQGVTLNVAGYYGNSGDTTFDASLTEIPEAYNILILSFLIYDDSSSMFKFNLQGKYNGASADLNSSFSANTELKNAISAWKNKPDHWGRTKYALVSFGGESATSLPPISQSKSVKSIIYNFIEEYALDGIDIDVEHDYNNLSVFIGLLEELRTHNKIITSAPQPAAHQSGGAQYYYTGRIFEYCTYVGFQFYNNPPVAIFWPTTSNPPSTWTTEPAGGGDISGVWNSWVDVSGPQVVGAIYAAREMYKDPVYAFFGPELVGDVAGTNSKNVYGVLVPASPSAAPGGSTSLCDNSFNNLKTSLINLYDNNKLDIHYVGTWSVGQDIANSYSFSSAMADVLNHMQNKSS